MNRFSALDPPARSGVEALLSAADNNAAEHQRLLDENAELHVRVQELQAEVDELNERIEERQWDCKDDEPGVMAHEN
jgi:peptidoglycan hydrolase CwlO-like protein